MSANITFQLRRAERVKRQPVRQHQLRHSLLWQLSAGHSGLSSAGDFSGPATHCI